MNTTDLATLEMAMLEARDKERERCAKIAESEIGGWDVKSSSHSMRIAARATVSAAHRIALAIRNEV